MTETDTGVQVIPIHTSDRISFKNCRRQWDLTSVLREGWRPKAVPRPLGFGSAVHKGLETLYHPDSWEWRWDDRAALLTHAAVAAFEASWTAQRKTYLKRTGREQLDELQEQEWKDDRELGRNMIRHYCAWSSRHDQRFHPIGVELDFEVQIDTAPDGSPIMYRGRLDTLMRDLSDGSIWVWDHKTAARFEDSLIFLERDEQVGSYCWAIQEMLGIEVAGVIYNELYKGYPQPPKRLQNERKGAIFSVSKSQDTTYEIYLQTLEENNVTYLEPYREILDYLKNNDKEFFRRIQIHRSPTELRNLGEQIRLEAKDMLNDPATYPNPNRFRCRWCPVSAVCLAMNDGSDYNWMLEQDFVRSTSHYGNIDGAGEPS